jgi:hypothetical protein
MADRKISDLTALTTPASGDFLPIVDISEAAAASKNKRITIEELMRGVPDGTAAAPGIAFETYPSTGVYSPGANQLAVATNGTRRLLIDSAGALTLDTGDATIYGVRVGRGGGAVATNTAVGASALSSNITGAFNTAIGNNALRVNTANVNTAVGDSALYSCTTGYQNVAIGPFALYSDVSGINNIAIGRDALYFNTATGNIAIGTGALKATTSGANNLGIGDQALFSNTEGTLNTVIGPRNTAYDNTTGSNNVVLGDLALRFNTTGSNNTCIGTNAGYGLTTGSNNTIIGNVQGTAGLANTVIIGAGATERLRIDSSGRVGVGTSAPGQKLEIAGETNPIIRITPNGQGDSWSTSAEYGKVQFWNTDFEYGGGGEMASISAGVNTVYGGHGYLKLLAGSNGSMRFWTNGSERVRIDSSGRVGIGSSTPQSPFVVSNGGANGIEIRPVESDIIAYNRSGAAWGDLKLNSANNIFQIQGAERARIDSSGRLLVGTSSTSSVSLLLVQGNSSSSTGGAVVSLQRGATSPTSGSLLGEIRFGDSSSNNGAYITGEADGAWTSGSSQPTRLTFFTAAAGSSSPTERMRISQNGQFSVFKDSGSSHFTFRCADTASSSAAFVLTQGATNNTNGTNAFIIAFNGNATNTNNSYGAISDIKLKENIVDANSQWDDLKALQVRKYNFKEGQTHTQIGLVAQEVELVSPGLVSESPDRDEDGNDLGTVTKSVNYSVLYMKAVKALQEAMERIETLEARLTAAGIE